MSMLDSPTCLHIPPLYEEGAARLTWESVEGADGYELDLHYDEDFDTASRGKDWTAIETAEPDWQRVGDAGLDWRQIEASPAQGLNWRNIEFRAPTWAEIDESGYCWSDLQSLPVEFTVYRGAEEPVQGPDQGLSWHNIESEEKTWAEMEALGWTWADFLFRASRGLTWAQLETGEHSWQDILDSGETWYAFENQAARGLHWGSLDARFRDWTEIEAPAQTWKEFENQPADSRTHIAQIIEIPLYKKKGYFRVRALRDGGSEKSDYLTSTPIEILPRSLAKYKPPCLHIPTLYREGTAALVWGDLYAAADYSIERKMSSEADFKVIYRGPGKPVHHPAGCKKPEELYYTPDCKQHFSFTDTIPIHETTAQYRIKGSNTTDESQYLYSEIITLLPRSLKKYKPPCLHIPALREGETQNMVWGDLYDASSYVLERKIDSGAYAAVFDGPGKQTPHPADCTKVAELKNTPDCKIHLTGTDKAIPYYAKEAQYRIKGYNTTDSSQYLESAAVTVIPVFYREDSVRIAATVGQEYLLQVSADTINRFADLTLTLAYDPNCLSYIALFSYEGSVISSGRDVPQLGTKIISQASGNVRFKLSKSSPDTENSSGAATLLRLKALKTATTQLTLS